MCDLVVALSLFITSIVLHGVVVLPLKNLGTNCCPLFLCPFFHLVMVHRHRGDQCVLVRFFFTSSWMCLPHEQCAASFIFVIHEFRSISFVKLKPDFLIVVQRICFLFSPMLVCYMLVILLFNFSEPRLFTG
jgi:hypothetical protein